MTFVNVTIKGLDEKRYRKIKGIAAEEGAKVSDVVNEGMEKIIESRKHKARKIDKNDTLFGSNFSVDLGVDTDVRNADKYIYR